MKNALPLTLIDPSTFEIDVTLEISCDDVDQILSRPVGDGFTYQDLIQTHVRFNGDDGDVGAIPAECDGKGRRVTGYCQAVELSLSAKTFGGATVNLGCFGSEEQIEEAKAAIALPITLLLAQKGQSITVTLNSGRDADGAVCGPKEMTVDQVADITDNAALLVNLYRDAPIKDMESIAVQALCELDEALQAAGVIEPD